MIVIDLIIPASTTIIIPRNDGESDAIMALAAQIGFDVHESKQVWGATLDKEPGSTFENLKQTVVIIEMPGPQRERELRLRHKVIIIDHHYYGKDLDRRNPVSSLEQFAEITGTKLSRRQIGVALNDRGFIPPLQREGYTEAEIQDIRAYDLNAQGYTSRDYITLEADYRRGSYPPGCDCYVVETRSSRISYLSDIHYRVHGGGALKTHLLVIRTTEAKFTLYRTRVGLIEHYRYSGAMGAMPAGKNLSQCIGASICLDLFYGIKH